MPASPSPTPTAASQISSAAVTPQVSPSATPAAPANKTSLRVFCAGSLINPFKDLEKKFEAAHPEVDVLTECHGSIQVIRHVTELHEKIDVVATADYALIPMLMYTTKDEETGNPYSDWYIRFATNRMALAYTPTSKGAGQINADNWYKVITQPGVRVGLADPRFDAAGYRALMVLRLAEDYYHQPGILKSLVDGRFTIPISIFEEANFTEIGVPEILEPVPNSGIVVRGASIENIALLESGDLDYAFEYESVIRQHGLKWVELPDPVNLGIEKYDPQYSQVQVKMDFRRFASVKPIFKGGQIGYAITVPDNAPQPELASQFIEFMLGADGREVFDANYQPMLELPLCDQPSKIPQNLRNFCAAGAQP